MIELRNVYKCFGDKIIFQNLNYTFKEGNIYHLKGDNGSGKSVLLRILTGFSLVDDGKVIIDDKEIGKDIDFIENAGVIINKDEFISYLSGYDNLKLLLDIQKKTQYDVIMDYAKFFDLEADIKDKPYRSYSQGMKQKLRLIQAFMESPKYLFLDEPTNALDKNSIDKLYQLMEQFKEEHNKIIIFITHTDDAIVELANIELMIENYNIKEEHKKK